ncbi:MAG: hypothetical protein AB7H66_14255 [Hyphomonadaceae bacterium]
MAIQNWPAAGLFAAVCCALAFTDSAAQTPLFSEESELQLTIDGPIGDLVRTARRSTDPHPAGIAVAGGPRLDIALSARGFSRRAGGICNFPPLRIDLGGDGQRTGTIWQGQNRLKLVTRCRASASYEQLTVLEYTAYRLYNVMTPLSYRVRPVRVTYRDTGGRRDETQFNFLIEDLDDVAERNGRVAIDVQTNEVRSSQLNGEQAALVGMFQFMIGNLDWDMTQGPAGQECCHNGKLMAASETARENVLPIPYDFDYSGFVNAPYAIPPEGIPVSNVRQRHYRGLCRFNDQARGAAELFRSRRAQLFAVIDGETRLPNGRRQAARAYIESFFEILDNPQRFERQIIENCRG